MRWRCSSATPELDSRYADLYDHVPRVSEWTQSLREMITAVFETNFPLVGVRRGALVGAS